MTLEGQHVLQAIALPVPRIFGTKKFPLPCLTCHPYPTHFDQVVPTVVLAPQNDEGEMTEKFAYLFEAKGIGRYIVESGRLNDLIGGSDLIAGLCTSDGVDDVLSKILQATGAPKIESSRRAGAAFCLHTDKSEPLDRIRALWRVAVGIRHPGLEFSDVDPAPAIDAGAALRAAYQAQPAVRENSAAFLQPTAHPFMAFNPRTGRAAVDSETLRDNSGRNIDLLDAVNAPQRRRGREIASKNATDRLARQFLPEPAADAAKYRFPRQFEIADASLSNPAFPFLTRDERVAVVHADISGLGQIFQRVTKVAMSADEVMCVASAIERAIAAAARAASNAILLPNAVNFKMGDRFTRLFGKDSARAPTEIGLVPARPVVLGGDDITVIVRADLALEFAASLLVEIERKTREHLAILGRGDLPEWLSACAGVAVVSAGHPFLAAETMAQGLCKHAKATAKAGGSVPYPSFVSFAVVTSTIEEEFRDFRAREQTGPDGFLLNGGPYAVGEMVGSGQNFANLKRLATALAKAPGRGKLIEALGRCFDDEAAATPAWLRFWKILDTEDETVVKELRAALSKFLPPTTNPDQIPDLKTALPIINDALELIDIRALDIKGLEG